MSKEWHRRRSIRFPAAKDRALRGALGKGPPRARLLPEPLRITGASLRLEELDFRIKKNRGERVECLHFDYFFDLHPYGDANRLWSCSSFHLDLIKLV